MDHDTTRPHIRQYASTGQFEHRDSVASEFSTQSVSSFPTHGLIKVSNSDQGSSCDSMSLLSPQGSTLWNNYEIKASGSPGRKSHISFARTLDPAHDENDDRPKTPKTPLSAATATFGAQLAPEPVVEKYEDQVATPLSLKLPFDEEAKGLKIPTERFDRVRYFLDRVIAAHQSEQGVFLTDKVFLNKKIFAQRSIGIPNGSVKVGIIQEITSILKKFVDNDGSLLSVSSVDATLHYYEKLMDAFDVFGSPSDERFPVDSYSMSTTPASPSRRQDSKEVLYEENRTPPQQQNRSSYTSEGKSTDSRGKNNRNSFVLLDKLKPKRKRKSMLSLDQAYHAGSPHTPHSLHNSKSREQLSDSRSPHRDHSRSISVSTTASSRSQRDQCLLAEYLALLDALYAATDDAYDKFGPGSTSNEILEKTIYFMDTHVVAFIMKDITYLALNLMKKSISDYC